MNDKKLAQLTKNHGAIICLSDAEKQQAIKQGYTVQEIQTPCGAIGNQAVSRPKR